METIAIYNQKGGTGKTTTTINLGHALALTGKKVLIIDIDDQGNDAECLGVKFTKSIYHLLKDEAPFEECIVGARKNLDLLASDETISQVALEMVGWRNRENALKKRLEGINYDFALIDCQTGLGILNENALNFCKKLLVPVSMEYLSVKGLFKVDKLIYDLREDFQKDLKIDLIVPTFVDERVKRTKEYLEFFDGMDHFKGIISPYIRIDTKLSESFALGKTIFEHSLNSRGAYDYIQLCKRVLEGI
ncbi:MAG: AAA family ATPase [Candidatus Methanofastidiosum sp.]|nr:AAA family ATPase [Methanofastidiosum sp.]